MSKVVKSRYWAIVAYPESAAPDWIKQLKLSGLKCAISPLHDKDQHSDPTEGDGKKPHWHVIACWEGPTTFKAVSELAARMGATIPIKLESIKGYYRYFTHADDPDKYQYDPGDIQYVGGFNIADYIEMTRGDRLQLMWEVQDYIRRFDVQKYADLLDALRDGGMAEHWEVAATNTLVFRAYIASRRCMAGGRKEEADG